MINCGRADEYVLVQKAIDAVLTLDLNPDCFTAYLPIPDNDTPLLTCIQAFVTDIGKTFFVICVHY